MRVAIIGGGASGLATAWMLQDDHEVHVFEAEQEPGGHARTELVHHDGVITPVETGFRYFFAATYPKLLSLMSLLDLELYERESRLTLTRKGWSRALSLPPATPSHVLQLCRRPSELPNLARLWRFMNTGEDVIEHQDWSLSLREYLAERGFSERFAEELLYPMIAASWGAPLSIMPDFPAYSVLKVMRLTERRPKFLFLDGGVSTYIGALASQCTGAELHLGCPVTAVRTAEGGGLVVHTRDGRALPFDKVVLATQSFVAAQLVSADPALARWQSLLEPFDHFDADICIHCDPAWMPEQRADWGDLNHFHTPEHAWMTEWLGRRADVEVFRTWLPPGAQTPERLWRRRQFRCLIVTKHNLQLQEQIAAAQGLDGIHAVGMYAGDVDNHESAVGSSMPVAAALAPGSARLASWRRAAEERRMPPVRPGLPPLRHVEVRRSA